MAEPRPPLAADRNLLFGILALQMEFIRAGALIAAMHAWVQEKSTPLGQILCDLGELSPERRSLLEALVQEHLKQHGSDPVRCLSTVAPSSAVVQELRQIADDELQASLAGACAVTDPDVTTDEPRFRDGVRYRRLRPHARGGLGEVFVAEDTELHREVALKEIQPQRAHDAGSRSRFILEAEITGGLEHPGIVPVYGLGMYPDGRPYYAMRFIRGESLKEAIERFHTADSPQRDAGERRLAFRQLLRRFVDVCNAIAYAHSRGVLHRDLKPANIMLGKYGETLVVDWGLAKAGISARDAEPTPSDEPSLRPASSSDVHATQAGAALGTPTYMSPEQANGRLDELGPPSDIYGLGATLYVLLTGRKPFQGADTTDVLSQVRRGAFLPPRRLQPDTPPALDAICCKAMALRPGDRYSSALALAAEVEHWLADEPVAAYPEPWTLRLGRAARRHRTKLVAAAVLLVSALVALSIGTVLIWREQQNTEEQRRMAEANYEFSRNMGFNLIDLLETAEAEIAAVPALHAARRDVLEAASRACRHYLHEEPDNPECRKRAAQIYRYTANVLRLTNETAEAEALYRESLQLQQASPGEAPVERGRRQRASETERDYATLLMLLGRLSEAETLYRRVLAVNEELRAAEGDRATYRRNRALVLYDLAVLEDLRGLSAQSGKSHAEALELFRALQKVPGNERHPYDPLLLCAAQNRLAAAERDAGHVEAALALHTETLKELQALLGRSGRIARVDLLNFTARCRLEQCRTWLKTPERRANAETNLGAVALQWELLAKDFPRVPMYREWQAIACRERGQVRAAGNRPDEARADLERARALLEGLAREFPQMPAYHAELGRTYVELGRHARRAADPAAAAWDSKAAEALGRAVAQSPDNAHYRRELAEVRAALAQ